jgi:hypothetical protein
MSNHTDSSYSLLGTQGYTLIRSFLDENEIEMLSCDFNAAPLEVNSNYSVRRISESALSKLAAKLNAVNDRVRDESGIDVDLANDGVFFATYSEKSTLTSLRPGPQAFPWHQDHENYWLWHDTRNYLNFYMPVVKPVLEKSNLTVVPFDRLELRAPELYRRMLSRGATRVVQSGSKWVIKDDDKGGKVGTLNFDLAEIEDTPLLAPGDLLLMRGDLIHRTQDSSTKRIAASVRFINSKTRVHRSDITRGGLVKAIITSNARYLFNPALDCFDQAGVDELPAGEIDAFLKELRMKRLKNEAPANSSRIAFLARLAKEKMFGGRRS